MYNVIDTSYDQNLGFSTSETSYDIVSKVLEGDRQLEEWRHGLVPSLGLHVLQKPLTARDIDLMKVDSVIFQRFNIVLSLRFHNLRILLHRKFLEKFLDMGGMAASGMAGSDVKFPQQVGVNSVHNCVESAIVIISTVHTVATTTGWHRGLLGAWNYSLYYSKTILIFECPFVPPFFFNAKQPSTPAWSSSVLSWYRLEKAQRTPVYGSPSNDRDRI
jgi:hypothetical protein